MEFLLRNTYIDTSVQKGGVPKMPGCVEHTGVVTQLLREAREGKGDLAVLWLDLANAYGSIPHRLVESSLDQQSAEAHSPSQAYSSPPIRAFMDDLTVTTTSVPGCRWILQGLKHLINWARMDFKPAKSRSLVVKKGKVTDQFPFTLGDIQIPSV